MADVGPSLIDKHVLAAVHSAAGEHNTPDTVVEALLAHLQPSIRLVPQSARKGASSPSGKSRIGGRPDLPPGVAWPRLSTAWQLDPAEVADSDDPLFFLMQINLSEVSPFDVAGLLPKAGMLWFFFHWTDEFNSEVPFILHRKRMPRRLERRDWPADLPEESRFRGLELEPRLEWTI